MFMFPATPARHTAIVYHIVFLLPSCLILLAIQSAQRRPCCCEIFNAEGFCLSTRGIEGEEEVLWAEDAEFIQNQLMRGEDVGDVEKGVGVVNVGAVGRWRAVGRFCCF